MVVALIGREPNPTIPPVRAFKRNPGFRITFDKLADLRSAMVEDDKAIIDSLALLNAQSRAEQASRVARKGTKRSYNIGHYVPKFLDYAKARHPREVGLTAVLTEVLPHFLTLDTVFQFDLDPDLSIDAIARRLNKAKQATIFKADKSEGLAPATQAINIARAVSLAEQRHPEDLALPAHVDRVYSVLVPATVAIQQTMFDMTYRLDDWDASLAATIADL